MTISSLTAADVISYIREDAENIDQTLLTGVMEAAKAYIASYTGIPTSSDTEGAETLDSYPDLSLAYLVLCQDMYDNRTMIPDTKYANSTNRVIENIMNLHPRNLI